MHLLQHRLHRLMANKNFKQNYHFFELGTKDMCSRSDFQIFKLRNVTVYCIEMNKNGLSFAL